MQLVRASFALLIAYTNNSWGFFTRGHPATASEKLDCTHAR